MIQKPFRGVQLNRTHPLAKGLVGCWLFNELTGETVFDLSGNDNNGTLENGVAWGNGGLEFDGSDDYVDCGQNPDLALNTLSLLARVKTTTTGTEIFVSKCGQNNYGHLAYSIFTNYTAGSPGTFGARIKQAGSAVFLDFATTKTINDGNWHYLGLTFDGTYGRLYIDGVLNTTSSAGGSINYVSSGQPLIISGQKPASSGCIDFFNGPIDNVNIYNRALSAKEIAWSYREPYAMFEPAFNPALLYSAAPPVGAIMNQFQKANIGADLYNGVFA